MWVSNARVWSAAARRLLHSGRLGETQLGFVALYLCVKMASLLVDGTPTGTVRPDEAASGDCPIDRRELHALRDRLRDFRSEIVHLSDNWEDEGRHVTIDRTAGPPPTLTLKSTVGPRGGPIRTDSMTLAEAEGFLDALDPWLLAHFERSTAVSSQLGQESSGL